MKLLTRLLSLLAFSFAFHTPAWSADPYPGSRPIKVIVPFGAGSGSDVAARIVLNEVQGVLGATFVVENLTGASGVIGAQTAAKAPADGYTLFLGTNTTQSANPSLFKKLPYDPLKDFVAITRVVSAPFILVVGPTLGVKNMAELAALAKAKPKTLSYGYSSVLPQVTGHMLAARLGGDVTGVAYRTLAQGMTDVISGQVTMLFVDSIAGLPQIKSGKVVPLAITSARRSSLAPEIPTMTELGFPNFELVAWSGFFAPAGTPKDIVDKLNDAFRTAMVKQAIKERFTGMGSDIELLSTGEFDRYLVQQKDVWARLLFDAGVEAQ